MKIYRHFYIRDEFVCDRIQSENEWKIIYSRNNLGGGGRYIEMENNTGRRKIVLLIPIPGNNLGVMSRAIRRVWPES